MERGFKSRCEEMSRSLRAELGLDPAAPLPAEQLASYLGVYLWSVEDLGLDPADVRQLVHNDPDSWSAITVSAAGLDAIILNPNHRRAAIPAMSCTNWPTCCWATNRAPCSSPGRRTWHCAGLTNLPKTRQIGWRALYCCPGCPRKAARKTLPEGGGVRRIRSESANAGVPNAGHGGGASVCAEKEGHLQMMNFLNYPLPSAIPLARTGISP